MESNKKVHENKFWSYWIFGDRLKRQARLTENDLVELPRVVVQNIEGELGLELLLPGITGRDELKSLLPCFVNPEDALAV